MLRWALSQTQVAQIQQISFDKGAPRYGALLGGQVDALFEQPGDAQF